jgi:citrate synthase
MTRMVILALAALSACSAPTYGGAAAQRYEMVSRHGDKDEVCAAAREVVDGYLRDRNETAYAEWHLRADNDCLTARLLG